MKGSFLNRSVSEKRPRLYMAGLHVPGLRMVGAAGTLLLAACGGGGGDTPSPTTPPPPPPSDLTELFSSNQDRTFTANSAVLGLSGTPGSVTSVGTGGAEQVTFDASESSLRILVTAQDGASFDATFSTSSGGSDTVQVQGSKTVITDSTTGAVLGLQQVDKVFNVPGGGTMSLRYSSFGGWEYAGGTQAANGFDQGFGYVAFGFNTAAADMPATGSATYTGLAEGTLIESSGGTIDTAALITGRVDIDVNFGSGAVSTAFTQMQKKVGGSPEELWRDFTVSGTLSGTGFTTGGSFDTNFEATVNGSFYGPTANEASGVWRVQGPGEDAVGAFVTGKQ